MLDAFGREQLSDLADVLGLGWLHLMCNQLIDLLIDCIIHPSIIHSPNIILSIQHDQYHNCPPSSRLIGSSYYLTSFCSTFYALCLLRFLLTLLGCLAPVMLCSYLSQYQNGLAVSSPRFPRSPPLCLRGLLLQPELLRMLIAEVLDESLDSVLLTVPSASSPRWRRALPLVRRTISLSWSRLLSLRHSLVSSTTL